MIARSHDSEPPGTSGFGRALSRTLAVLLLVFGFLPVANLIGGGHAAPWYGPVLQSWLSGTAIVAGVIAIVLVLSRHKALTRATHVAHIATAGYERKPRLVAAVIASAAVAVYSATAWTVFDARPVFIDEIVQMYQARLLADGSLTEVVGPFPEFFGVLNAISVGDRQFGQFPPGGPAHLALGVVLGVPWLITPLVGGAAVFVFAMFVRQVESERSIALGATLLFAFSPFMVFMSASHMNHVPTLFWVLVAWLGAGRLTLGQGGTLKSAALFGLATGVAATIRPVDAAVLTLPAITWWLWTARRRVSAPREVAAFSMAAALPLGLLFMYNHATTGSALLFGYDLMWGKSHSLGFHESPWGVSHTPARGAELLNLYALRLQSYLFESPAPSLLPVVATLAFARRHFNAMLLCALCLLFAAYFAYWHDGFYLGPRFTFVGLPVLVLLAARAPRSIGDATGRPRGRQLAFLVLVVAIAGGFTWGTLERGRYYARSLATSRHTLTRVADSLGIHDALIFVRESWGSQVLARLWGRGIERSDAELLYRDVDTCILDSTLTVVERQNQYGPAARARLWPLLSDSASVRPSALSPDGSQRIRAGNIYSAHCLERVADDQRGVALYPLVLAQSRGSNVYARDLGPRNEVLRQRYASRRAYLLVPRALDSDEYVLSSLDAEGAPAKY